MVRFIKIHILPYVIYFFYKFYMLFVKFIEPKLPKDISTNFIVAHFHQDELALVNQRTNSNFCTMTSTSTDGELMTRFLNLMGYQCVRGSSTRGGSSALLQMVRLCSSNKFNPVMAVDGPKGPIYKVKAGVIELSKLTGLPILPVSIKYSSAFCIQKSWNKAMIPKPFSKVTILFGKPIVVQKGAEKKEIEEKRESLEHELYRLKYQ